MIVAGSRQYPGALELAARAALNSRAGMVHVVAAETVFTRLPGLPPELLRHELSGADQSSLESDWLPARTDALCVGPGWGRDPDRPDRLRSLFGRCLQGRIPLVVDADGLDALRQTGPLAHAGLILTPHAGELAKLADCSSDALAGDPQPILVQVARRFQATVLLKGPVTWIVSPDSKISVYDGANPLLAQAGSGDILAGIMVAVLSGLVRLGLDGHAACLRAAQIACLVLAAAGRQAITSLGWASSSGVLTALPRVWADLSAPGLRGSSNWGGESMIQSVAGVLIRDGRILLARRKSGGDMGGRWELPGGKCEGMEGPVAALIREFDEEFSLMIMVGPACAETVFRHHGKDHQVRAYRIETEGSFDKLAEHDEVAWFSLKNLPPRPTIVDSDAELLDQLAGHGR